MYAAMTAAIKASESETRDDGSFVCPRYLPHVLQCAPGFSPHLLILLAVGGLPSCQGNDMLTSPLRSIVVLHHSCLMTASVYMTG